MKGTSKRIIKVLLNSNYRRYISLKKLLVDKLLRTSNSADGKIREMVKGL